ncbi:bifunctional 3-(3-hydroxy-phenyl)propionate/3-hydroxycinnamic acid hydroxylase [Kineosporia sp. J2-2]|uniref:Bifunctional 3-(3-hydroxy-phenyl)propionate/3-hydroxycinnamic acid hydroxylase n=1 Tax=Kineosporia corallincola TaxID=2835133 RepID=A0ABS5TL63_9ACTN|nr:bifunctional 3-(3-hydroxy-phenyl)propionate/3-hydroxycinnamic acid hydroxylase [Kineosporia corallincola]MBT0771842.1 bifunctional 3-(3-hydroxy-phenyl)propionate/3-hydroxycinnamic acid hydroxylase [Kineosporia corallincola]
MDAARNDPGEVVVVGAGPVGLVTALLLARHGVRSLVLERHPRPYPLPRAVHLDDECRRILQNVGVADGFARISRPAAGLRLLDARHRTLAEFRRSGADGVHGHPQASLFDQPDLETLLLEAVSRQPRIRLRRGVRVTGVDAGGGVHWCETVGGWPGPENNQRTAGVVRAAAVVGCDGAGGVVRQALGSGLRRLAADQNWFVADLLGDPPVRVWDGVEQICDPARPATYLRVGERRMRWEFRMRPGETVSGLTGRLGELLGPWLPGGVGEREVLRTAHYTFRAVVARRWRRGRVLIAGDAAHLTPPFIGQGLGSGLRDAANLSWKLALVLHGRAGDPLLDSYQAEREPHATALIRLAVLAGAVMGSPAANVLRPAARAPVLGNRLTDRLLAGTSPPLRSGALVPARRPGLVGTLFPQLPLGSTTTDDENRLDDLLGPGFALLTLRDASPARIAGRAGRLGARVIRVPGSGLTVVHRWMTERRCEAVLLRPDRVVLDVT